MDDEIYSHLRAYRGKVKKELIEEALKAFDTYRADKADLEARICENSQWYRSQYWQLITKSGDPQPATGFIFNAVENKYAEAVDNYPTPNIIERMPDDENTAKLLSKILPIQMDTAGFKKCYKENWRRKLKHGTAIYGIFYNEETGSIEIKSINILNIYCDMHTNNVQDSPFLFIASLMDNARLKRDYPKFRALFDGDARIRTYSGTHSVPGKTQIIDCYYKKHENGRDILHMMKLADGCVIDATEDREGLSGGLYAHGLYPVVFDVMYPEDDMPFGFGVVDILKNPQIYIDKLDGTISKNAVIAGKIRYMIKDHGGINEKEVADYSKDIIHVAGSVDDSNIRQLQARTLDDFVITHRQNKILELKEIIGNRDFQQGGTFGGVTAASAITSLQQAGEKVSRAIIDDSFDCYKHIVLIMIELIREFYTDERIYRITDEHGNVEFRPFSAKQMYHKKKDCLGFDIASGKEPAEFDVEIVPKRENPLSKEANNQMILTLWQSGLFAADDRQTAIAVLEAMQFDGKEKLIQLMKMKEEVT